MTTWNRGDKGKMRPQVDGKPGKVFNYHNHPGVGTTFTGGLTPKLTKRGLSRGEGAKNQDLKVKI